MLVTGYVLGSEGRKLKIEYGGERTGMKKLLIKLLLGNNKSYFNLVKLKGKIYKVDIQPYVSVKVMMKMAENSGVFTANSSKTEVE